MRALVVFVLLGISVLSAHAASPISLFLCEGADPSPILDYPFTVAQLKAGDVLKFCDGKMITLGESLGQGNSVRVFSVQGQPKLALRIARSPREIADLKSTVDGYSPLKKAQVPTPKLIGGDPRQYLLVERVPGRLISLGEAIAGIGVTEEEYAQLIRKLPRFLKPAADFATLGDLHAQNLVYSVEQKRWILIDYYNDHHFYFLPRPDQLAKSAGKPYRTTYTALHGALIDLEDQSYQHTYRVGKNEVVLTPEERSRMRRRITELKELSNEITSSRRSAMIRVYEKSLGPNGCLPARLRHLVDRSPIDESPLPF